MGRWLGILRNQLYLKEEPLLIVTYEDLKANVSQEVLRMLEFLGINYSPNTIFERLRCESTTFKRSKPLQRFDPYTPEQRNFVRSCLKEFLKSLDSMNRKSLERTVQNYFPQI
jgi:hypothetical protein